MLVIIVALKLKVFIAQLATQVFKYLPSISVYCINSHFFDHEVVQKYWMWAMSFGGNYFSLFPFVYMLVRQLKLDKPWVHLL